MTYWIRVKDGNLVEEVRTFSKAFEKIRELEKLDEALNRKQEYEIVTEEGKVLA